MANERLVELDFIKGIAILSVLLLHTIPESIQSALFSYSHIGQAVPVFIAVSFLLGFRSLDGKNNPVKAWFTNKRLLGVLKRILIPYFIVVGIQVIMTPLVFNRSLCVSDLLHGWGGARPRLLLSMGLLADMVINAISVLAVAKVRDSLGCNNSICYQYFAKCHLY